MTLAALLTGLGIWLAFLVACFVWAWVKLGQHDEPWIVQVLPTCMVLICVSLILFFVLRALFHM